MFATLDVDGNGYLDYKVYLIEDFFIHNYNFKVRPKKV